MAQVRINKDLKQDLERLRAETDGQASVSWLMSEFKWWQPVYKPRGQPKDPENAQAMAMQRAVFGLYQKATEAIFNRTIGSDGQAVRADENKPVLNIVPTDIPRLFDLNEVAAKAGGEGAKKRGNQRQPDYIVRIDDEFALFTQALSSIYGGPKPRKAIAPVKEPSEAFKNLHKSLSRAIDVKERATATKKDLKDALDQLVDDYMAYAQRLRSLPRPESD